MKTAFILHGMPPEKDVLMGERKALSNNEWIPWIQERLIKRGILAQAPELPRPEEPRYEEWRKVVEQFVMNEETILIGHSCGAGFLVRWLSERSEGVNKLVLVAPWMDPEPRRLTNGFFEFEIDPTLQNRVGKIIIFSSEDDDIDIHLSVDRLKGAWPKARHIKMTGKGHFTETDMQQKEFPELEEILFEE